ncbi:MAG: helix-turn-helix domain-containing protein [Candidatus Humimicrobiaceae bacterium]|jgi:excisionase family DNA binding protein|nr:helix-turn-helix domain-containing protein [Actinomycetota bacterium]MDY0027794.1 helix-turn-helix domain-containing protein [Candidatus Humimicrobiaceae bacterium]
MGEEKRLFTIKEVSELIGISESEVIRMIMLKKLAVIRVGKAIRIKEDDFEKFLNEFAGVDKTSTDHKEPVLYTAEQVAKILKLSVDNVWNLLKTGRLKGFKVREGRSSWRIPAESLDDFIENRIGQKK